MREYESVGRMNDYEQPREELVLIPHIDREKRRWDHIAWRMVRAGEQNREIYDSIPGVVEAWDGTHPILRAPRNDQTAVEVVQDAYSWEFDKRLRDLTLLASECLHHTRAALDYLAYQLVSLAGATAAQLRTQFPLAERLDQFEQWEKAWLPGIPEAHRSIILSVQPFNGVQWTKDLRVLSNQDKHRIPVDVVPCYGLTYDPNALFDDPMGQPDYLGYQVEDATLSLRFNDTQAVDGLTMEITETLHGIVVGASELISKFLVEFGENPIKISRV